MTDGEEKRRPTCHKSSSDGELKGGGEKAGRERKSWHTSREGSQKGEGEKRTWVETVREGENGSDSGQRNVDKSCITLN